MTALSDSDDFQKVDELLADAEMQGPTFAGEPTERKCRRHRWAYFSPALNRIVANQSHETIVQCMSCGKPKDLERSRRGRLARLKGNRIQRERIVGLGGRNLAGNNPNLDGLGQMFAYESKSGGAFSDRYWRWLTDIPKRGNETGVLIVTETPGPGRRARSYVVVEYGQWRDLHGELEEVQPSDPYAVELARKSGR